MPAPKGPKRVRCAMQRAIFARDPEAGRKWVEEYGDQCKGISMAATQKAARGNKRRVRKVRSA
jgi:hypothetical protein